MRCLDTLMHEHRLIEHGLAVLLAIAKRWQDTGQVNVDKVISLLDFFKIFADVCHHAKEENVLFPELERRGIPREGGPIGVMLYDHEEGRRLLAQMHQALRPPWNQELFIRSAQDYVHHLRRHIWKEDNVLFQLAQRILPENIDAEIQSRFEQHELEQLGPGVHERYHQLLQELLQEFSVAPEALAAVSAEPPAGYCDCSSPEHYHKQAGLPSATG